MRTWTFAKGHGTRNDFVILLDRTGMVDPEPAAVRYLCDRHGGIGGDGLLRVVPGRHVADWHGDDDVWFMDYRNADGSIAEMCGNGIRVFARYLLDRDLADGPELTIGTRAGAKQVTVYPDGRVRVGMGQVRVDDDSVVVTIGTKERRLDLTGRPVDLGNPHLVAEVSDLDVLRDADLRDPPGWPTDRFPHGVNLELIVPGAGTEVAMRVYERGVGETQACGTGTVAAAAVASALAGGGADTETWQVDVPGGRVEVELAAQRDGSRESWLTGPAVIVAHGEVGIP